MDVAILGEGDRAGTTAATFLSERFTPLREEFQRAGLDARVVAFGDDQVEAVYPRLRACGAVIVFVNPLHGGRDRTVLDGMLNRLTEDGRFVSARPATIMKMGTKDVLVDTQGVGWSRGDIYRRDTLAEVVQAVQSAGRAGQIRVLKQWRGNGGSGVWRVMAAPGTPDRFRAIEASRESREAEWTLEDLKSTMAPYFERGGHMVDQPYYPPVPAGMLRCYLTQDRVVGFGHQYITALMPAAVGEAPPPPAPRLYHPPDHPAFQELRRRMEREWVPALQEVMSLDVPSLPVIWDADFLWERPGEGSERFELCEINVSSVFPYPDSAIRPMVEATLREMRR